VSPVASSCGPKIAKQPEIFCQNKKLARLFTFNLSFLKKAFPNYSIRNTFSLSFCAWFSDIFHESRSSFIVIVMRFIFCKLFGIIQLLAAGVFVEFYSHLVFLAESLNPLSSIRRTRDRGSEWQVREWTWQTSEQTGRDRCHDTTFMYYIRSPTTKIAYSRRPPARP